jgi:predicted alpha/beta superfamily hydrolase
VTGAKTPNGSVIRCLGSGLIAIFIGLLSACGGGGGQPPDPATFGSTSVMSVNSKETGLAYDVDIWLPPGYAQSTATYPVIYAMDCEYRFTTLTQVLQETAAKLILVNVCAMGGAMRWIDFTMPGALAYYHFLIRELIPLVDSRWRTDTTNRTLSGHSLSGEFALYALYLEDPANRIFTSIISEECSCWYDSAMFFSWQLPQPIAMEQAMYQSSHRLPVNLVMAGDTQSNESNVAAVYATIASRNYEGLRAVQPVYSLGHVPMDGPAFRDALGFIFNIH